MEKKVAVVLSGCGNRDGSEIHESVLVILALVKSGAAPLFYAPDIYQERVVNFLTGDTLPEKRSVLLESARIARGKIENLALLKAGQADALIFPGGQGAALNLCDFLKKGAECTAHPEVARVINEFHSAKKPLGFICIAPAIAARVLGAHGVELTIGNDRQTAAKLEKMGARHVDVPVQETHIDVRNRVVSTPAYMLAKNIAEADAGIAKLVHQVLEMA
jgi:enhancing lycopene biosynthesis protein 2